MKQINGKNMMKTLFATGCLASLLIGGATDVSAAQLLDFSGDARFRQEVQSIPGRNRVRTRARFRLGSAVDVNPGTRVNFGFATGSMDPRSTNVTFDSGFQSLEVQVDYVYVDQKLADGVKVLAGKMKNPIHRTSTLLWDSDIRPDGVAFIGDVKANGNKAGLLAGFFVVQENSGKSDQYMAVVQPRVKAKLGGAKGEVSVGYFHFINVKNRAITNSAGTNTMGVNYNAITAAGKLKLPKMADAVPMVALVGEFVYNPDAKQTGALMGLKLGSKKVKKFGDWQTKFNYRYLKTDAWLDVFPNSDFFGGGTGAKGFVVSQKMGVAKNVAFALTAYLATNTGAAADVNRNIYHADVIIKI